jgi:hypothetical protein
VKRLLGCALGQFTLGVGMHRASDILHLVSSSLGSRLPGRSVHFIVEWLE